MKLSSCNRCDNCGSSNLNIGYILKIDSVFIDSKDVQRAREIAKLHNKGIGIQIEDFYGGRPLIYELPYKNQDYIEVDMTICASCIALARSQLPAIITLIQLNRGY